MSCSVDFCRANCTESSHRIGAGLFRLLGCERACGDPVIGAEALVVSDVIM